MSLSARLDTLHGINLEAAARRARLRNPPNAVKDNGINLEKPVKGVTGVQYARFQAQRKAEQELRQFEIEVLRVEAEARLTAQRKAEEEARKIAIPITETSGDVAGHFGLEGGYREEIVVNQPQPMRPMVEQIQKEVCRQWGVKRIDMISVRRTKDIVEPRQIAMALSKLLTLASLPLIGRLTGHRDHTTALHAIRKYEWLTALLPSERTKAMSLPEIVALAKHYYERGPQLEAAE